jgi:tetraacyldisaccharide 4'-kinase
LETDRLNEGNFGRLLYALSIVYFQIVCLRTFLYKKGMLKIRELPCCVISIGNLCAGGAGKTPMTLYLCAFLTGLGYRVAIVSRGYKGTCEKTGAIVSDGQNIFLSPEQSGDEPYMMASVMPVPVVVGKNRFRAGTMAVEEFFPDILLLDDAFQHISLKRDLDLLLLDAARPFGNSCMIPRGLLREPVTAVRRSDAVILTRSNKISESGRTPDLSGKPFFFSTHDIRIETILNPEKIQIFQDSDITDQLAGLNAYLFSGIAKNTDFHESCKKIGLNLCAKKEFSDHHQYNSADISEICKDFSRSRAQVLVTTHKDYVKIKEQFPSHLPLLVLTVELEFVAESKARFEIFMMDFLARYFGRKPLKHS